MLITFSKLLHYHFPLKNSNKNHHIVLAKNGLNLGVIVNDEVHYFTIDETELERPEQLVDDIQTLIDNKIN